MEGLVIRTTGSWHRVLAESAVYDCRLRGSYRLRGNKQTNPVAVGDRVRFEVQEDGVGVITDVLDRRNYLVRKATKLSKQTHVIASNIDLLCVVATLGFPRTSTGFIDRLLATAEAYHIIACIVYNKSDLHDVEDTKEFEVLKERYERIGYKVYLTSAEKGIGIEQLREAMSGKLVLFSGHSGVGKSALLNAIDPTLDLREGEVSEWSKKGKHTTTFAEIHPISNGNILLIDTPGIKEFGIVDMTSSELGHFFPEIRGRLHGCRFNTCTHTHEPGCAVKEAVERGEIDRERYDNYLGILNQIEDDKTI